MTVRLIPISLAIAATFPSAVLVAQAPASQPPDRWSAVEKELGRSGTVQPDGAIKFGFPRSDLTVKIGGITLRPAFALGSWIAFARTNGNAMMMGDLVLLESEIPGVTDLLRRGTIQETALHNHLLNESPHVMYMHISAIGDPVALARALHAALASTRTPLAAAAASSPGPLPLDTAALANALGVRGKLNGAVYQVSVARKNAVLIGGAIVPPSMGISTAINFEPADSGRVATTGDFVLLASEVNAVARALADGGISVTAIHSHMLEESPRLIFMHFWGVGDGTSLARTLRHALGQVSRKSR